MEKSGLFNSTETVTRAYQAIDFALPQGALAGGRGGIMMGIGTDFVPKKTGDKSISIGSGFAFLGEMPGFWYYKDESTQINDTVNTDGQVLTFPPSVGLSYVNLVAIKMDPITEMAAEMVVINGIADEVYTEPSVAALHALNGDTVYYVPIAKVVMTNTSEDGQKIDEVIDIRETTVGNSSISAFGVEAGYCAIQQLEDEDTDDDQDVDIARGTWKKSYYGIGISDGSRIVNQGLCNIDLRALRVYGMKKAIAAASDPAIVTEAGINAIVLESQPEAEDIWPLTYYVQEDGRIDTTPTAKIAGFSLSENLLLVNMQGPFGQDKDYDGEIEGFNVMPGPDNKVRFKLKLPDGAKGVLLKYKSTPWTAANTVESGIKIVDLEADSDECQNAYGDNKWYEVEIKNEDETLYNLSDPIYVKAFPYANGYNTTIGKHEKTVSVGSLLFEWTGDGANATDENVDGINNLSMSYVATQSGKIGQAFVGTDGKMPLTTEQNIGGCTLAFWLYPTGTDTGLFGHTSLAHLMAYIGSNVITFGSAASNAGYGISADQYYHIAFTVADSSMSLFINGQLKASTALGTTASRVIDTIGRANIGASTTSVYKTMNCRMDQIRIFDRILPTTDIENLYNDGAGC